MELGFIKDMFNSIAPRYDFLNRLLSLRRDVYWRREMIKALWTPQNGIILDAACGTGDVMIELLKQKPQLHQVMGIDFAPEMLKLARKKINSFEAFGKTRLIAGNSLALPFSTGSFDAITIAFGIRNIMDRKAALQEFFHHLKPGGSLAVLELATPTQPILKFLYLAYFKKILPGIGGFFASNAKAYRYLPASVIRFPEPGAFAALMQSAGFQQIRWYRLTMGLCTLHIGIKPGNKY